MFNTNIKKYGYKTALLDPNNRKLVNEKSNTTESRNKQFKTKRLKTIKRWNSRLLVAQTKYNITLLDCNINFGETFINDGLFQFHWKCNKCNTEFVSRFTDLKGILCPRCNNLHGSSNEEHELIDFVASIVGKDNIITRKMLLKANATTRFQIDVYIPKLKLGFEYDGLYYHQYDPKNENFHLNKTILAEENEIKLVHIRSDMWINENNKTK